MTSYVVLSGADVLALTKDKPVVIYIDGKPHTLCTDEYFEKETRCKLNSADKEGGMTNGDMIKVLYPGNVFDEEDEMTATMLIKGFKSDLRNCVFNKDWWDAPYKGMEG